MKNVTGCLDTLRVLRSSLHVSYHGDGIDTKKNDPQSPKKKGKKKKGAAIAGDNVVPTAKPASNAEILAWEARADLLESELYRISETKDKSYEDIINGAIDKLGKALLDDDTDKTGVLEFTKAQLLLHKAMVNNNPSSKDAQPLIDALDSLPSSIKSCPGVIATLASLHASLNKESSEELLSSLGNTIPAKLAMAEYKMELGQYDEAVELLQGIVDEGSGGIEATALLAKALSYTDPTKAEEYVEELQLAMEGVVGSGGDVMDGEALESMDIPRFAKKELSSTSSGSSTKVRKMIAATGGKGRSNMGERKKTNRESVLRKRAKQREAYLKRLESEGRYDPNKIPLTKPDPERWIPKSQRSYNRRGRGRGGGGGRYNNKSNVGAQGGGAGAGMEKDAAKLDVAARVAAKASGGDTSGKPSTANIKVSSSGTTRKGKGGKRR